VALSGARARSRRGGLRQGATRRLAGCREVRRGGRRSTLRRLSGGAHRGRDAEHRVHARRSSPLTTAAELAADAPPPVPAAAGRTRRFQEYQARSSARRAEAERLEGRSRLGSNLRGLAFAVLVIAFLDRKSTR